MATQGETRIRKLLWQAANPEKVREANRRWRKSNPLKVRTQAAERMRRWRERHRHAPARADS